MVRGAVASVLRERATLRSARRAALDDVVRRGAQDSVSPAVERRRCGALELRRARRPPGTSWPCQERARAAVNQAAWSLGACQKGAPGTAD